MSTMVMMMKKEGKGWRVVEHKSGRDEEGTGESRVCRARIETDRQEKRWSLCAARVTLAVVAEAKTAGASALAAHRAALASLLS